VVIDEDAMEGAFAIDEFDMECDDDRGVRDVDEEEADRYSVEKEEFVDDDEF
jgi:hypothetical protein